MKKSLLLSTIACVVFLSGCAQRPVEANSNSTGDFNVEKQVTPQNNGDITEESAKEIALNHAKLKNTDVTFVKSQMDFDNNIKVYEIEFYADSMEYDYDISAATGEILSWDKDIENYTIPNGATAQSGGEITEESAKEIALNHAKLKSTDVSFIKSQMEFDDGIKTYDIEFYAGNIEYNYDINAVTGEILSWDKDMENYTIPTGTMAQSGGNITEDGAKKIALDDANLKSTDATLVKAQMDMNSNSIGKFDIKMQATSQNNGRITEARAKEIALNHAKIKSTDVTFVRSQMDIENGIRVYEIEFYAGNMEYDYDISAATGEILSWDKDIENYTIPNGTTIQNGGGITEARAKEIALDHAKIKSTDVIFVKSQMDIDNGIRIYEIEFYAGNMEYDYDINAATGEILSWDKDIENYTIPNGTTMQSGGGITEARAKEIALDHAKIKSTDVTFVKSQMDFDHGIKIYEIEFYAGNMEYDYDINAATGEILSWDKDIENYTIPNGTTIQSGGGITEARAKEIALDHAKVRSTDVTFVKAQIDFENGIQVYEIEFYAGNMEYDYDINAATGAILSWDIDMDND